MSFGVIFWAAGSWNWYDGLMHQAEMYKGWRRLGVVPDMFAVINWTGSPTTTLAEWDGHSRFTRSIRDFANTYLPTPTSAFGLQPNDVLFPNQSRMSVDGRFRLTYQSDGNLVLYSGSSPLWASNTSGTTAGTTEMQGDGNLVVYDGFHNAVWSSQTYGYSGAFLVVQSDGNLVIYNSVYAIWATNTGVF